MFESDSEPEAEIRDFKRNSFNRDWAPFDRKFPRPGSGFGSGPEAADPESLPEIDAEALDAFVPSTTPDADFSIGPQDLGLDAGSAGSGGQTSGSDLDAQEDPKKLGATVIQVTGTGKFSVNFGIRQRPIRVP